MKIRKKRQKEAEKYRTIDKVIKRILILILVLFLAKVSYDILKLNVLNKKYIMIMCGIELVAVGITAFFMNNKNRFLNVIGALIYIAIMLGLIYFNFSLYNKLKVFLKPFGYKTEKMEYVIATLKEHELQTIEDLKEKEIEIIYSKDENIEKCLSHYKEKGLEKLKENENSKKVFDDLINKQSKAVLMNENLLMIYDELTKEDKKEYEIVIIDRFSIERKREEAKENKNQGKIRPLNILVTGSDSRSNEISALSRSDVNMIITVNPETRKVLLTSIPRDYFVQPYGTTGYKDKLTHLGIYGVDMLKNTLGDLFDIKIDYTAKFGFKSVVDLVDFVGGIDVHSDYNITTLCNDAWAQRVVLKKGMNHLNGRQALSFARERYAYPDGDRQRVRNQQQVTEKVFDKLIKDKKSLSNTNELLTKFGHLYLTDMPQTEVLNYIDYHLTNGGDWSVEKQSVDGTGANEKTYSVPNQNLYVMVPNQDTLNKAKEKINNVLGK